MKLAKYSEKFDTEVIFKIVQVVNRTPRPVYEMEDLNDPTIEDQFYWEELTPVRISIRTIYKIDKILDKRRRNVILENLVRLIGYRKDIDSWVPADRVKKI